ncbi:MFS transporter prlL [Pseudocercospora fuligena]|uniref:MFS transporter prlL n=1 Tax=Pseudocercospora fuligena TaxID=685502 RepID=A0A8H6RDC9_9PEZI|nr:MFS transporter prlL [Pseudocercospora fuligena]
MSSDAPKASDRSEKVTFEIDTNPTDDSRGAQNVRAVPRDQPVPPYDNIQDDDLKEDEAATVRNRTLLTSDEEKTLFKRVDIRLLPLLAIMYVVKTMDAANVSNARIMDRGTKHNIMIELGMSANDYNLVTVAYYIPYIVAEAPSNLLLKYFSPSVWQARVMVSWGIVLVCHAAVTNAGGLYTVRALLGLFEAGLWPGILLQLCYWYRPDEIAKRIVLVTVLGNFSAVSGLLAFGFNGVNTAGLSSWKWLILTEGIFTIALGVVVYFYLPDFPGTAKWLSDKEKTFLEARLPSASPRSEESDFDWQEFKNTLKDYRLWLFVFVWAFYTIGTTGLTFYQPTVIADLGFTTVGQAQLLTIPPAVFSCMLVLFFGWVVQTARIPTPSVPMFFMIAIEACYAVEYTYPNIGGVYAATTLAGGFSTAWYNLMWPWRVQTISGATGSAFAIAFANSYGQIGGAVGAQLFNSKYAPKYTTSFAIAMGFVGLAIITASITWYFTGRVDIETRKIRRARIAAAKENKAVLDDVEVKDVRSNRV